MGRTRRSAIGDGVSPGLFGDDEIDAASGSDGELPAGELERRMARERGSWREELRRDREGGWGYGARHRVAEGAR